MQKTSNRQEYTLILLWCHPSIMNQTCLMNETLDVPHNGCQFTTIRTTIGKHIKHCTLKGEYKNSQSSLTHCHEHQLLILSL